MYKSIDKRQGGRSEKESELFGKYTLLSDCQVNCVWRMSRNHLHYFMAALRTHLSSMGASSVVAASQAARNRWEETPSRNILMDDIPERWQQTSIFLAPTAPTTPTGDIDVVSFGECHSQNVFVTRTSTSFIFHDLCWIQYSRTYRSHFDLQPFYLGTRFTASATLYWYGKKANVATDACHIFYYHFFLRFLLVLSPESLRVSFFPELHRLNVASFHPRHFFFVVKSHTNARKHFGIAESCHHGKLVRRICRTNIARERNDRIWTRKKNWKRLMT